MNKKQKKAQQVEKFLKTQFLDVLQDIVIFQDDTGDYELFNLYTIQQKNKEYVVTMKTTHTEHIFNTLKNACAWCILDKRNMVTEAKRVLNLDHRLASLEVDIFSRTQLFKKSKSSDNKLLFLSKINEDKIKKEQAMTELHMYINETKKWQNKRFEIKTQY
jgi:hypothetical protein